MATRFAKLARSSFAAIQRSAREIMDPGRSTASDAEPVDLATLAETAAPAAIDLPRSHPPDARSSERNARLGGGIERRARTIALSRSKRCSATRSVPPRRSDRADRKCGEAPTAPFMVAKGPGGSMKGTRSRPPLGWNCVETSLRTGDDRLVAGPASPTAGLSPGCGARDRLSLARHVPWPNEARPSPRTQAEAAPGAGCADPPGRGLAAGGPAGTAITRYAAGSDAAQPRSHEPLRRVPCPAPLEAPEARLRAGSNPR